MLQLPFHDEKSPDSSGFHDSASGKFPNSTDGNSKRASNIIQGNLSYDFVTETDGSSSLTSPQSPVSTTTNEDDIDLSVKSFF